MSDHPYGWLSLLPPAVAIVLSIMTRRVVLSLLAGVFAGALILSQGNPIAATGEMFSRHLLAKLLDSNTLHIFFFTLLMGMMVGVINRAAGMRGLVNVVTPFANTRRRGQMVTWFLGLIIFFDDYANTVLLGSTLKPLTDKLKISREKLAYMVDSTAAPVAGLALISTWIAGEIGFVQEGLDKVPDLDVTAYQLFVASIPYRFYILWALLFVPIIALLGRDFGPMLKAERRASAGKDREESSSPTEQEISNAQSDSIDVTSPDPKTRARWFNAVIPIIVTVGAVVWFLYQSGEPDSKETLMEVFGAADSYSSLLWGALSGVAAAFALIVPQRIVPLRELIQAAGWGAVMMMPALMILWLAQALSTMTGSGSAGADVASRAAWMQLAGASNAEIASELSEHSAVTAIAAFAHKDHLVYSRRLARLPADDESSREEIWKMFSRDLQQTAEFLRPETLRDDLIAAGFDTDDIDFMLRVSTPTEVAFHRQMRDASTPSESVRSVSAVIPIAKFVNRSTRLYTGDFLAGKLGSLRESEGFFSKHFAQLLPTIVYLLAGIVAFSTGTSWGTMGIVMPLVIPLAYSQILIGSESVPPDHPILLCCVASVLAGAIFGDHCSPISDTTVLSSQASGCDHAAHVYTQLPYALLVAVISIVLGTLPVGFGVSVWLMLPAGVIVMLALLLIFGKRSSYAD